MRYWLFGFIGLLVMTQNAFAWDGKDRSYFFQCEQDSDCIVFDTGVPCGVTAANKKYKNEAIEHWKEMAPYIECAALIKERPEQFVAYCNAKKHCDKKLKP